jgi:hypothetical protein
MKHLIRVMAFIVFSFMLLTGCRIDTYSTFVPKEPKTDSKASGRLSVQLKQKLDNLRVFLPANFKEKVNQRSPFC